MVANSAPRRLVCAATVVARADSACRSAAFYSALRRASARFSVTVKMDPTIAAIAAIG